MQIDLNCDMGESFGNFISGNDEVIMPFISSANIACGFHAGDPSIIHKTIRLANKLDVAVGAHPSYPDLQGFGRREMKLDVQEIYDTVLYQTGAIDAFMKASGKKLNHVKPHGALYNKAAIDPETADAIAQAVHYFNPELILFGPSNSCLMTAATAIGVRYCREAFADRTYSPQGLLTPRTKSNALITDESASVKQVIQIVEQKSVTATDGSVIALEADTICIHGDGKSAVKIAMALYRSLTEKGIIIKAPSFS